MSIKPLVTTEMVLPVLREYFDRPIRNLEVIQGGNVAQAFSFSVGSGQVEETGEPQDFIIRFNPPMTINFEKEAYAYDKFASPIIPIPRVIQLGRLENIFFAITEKISGRNLLQIPRPEYLALIPKLVQVLDAIHRISIGDVPGYGIFDGMGTALTSTCKEHLELIQKEEAEGDFMGRWHVLFQNSFLEKELFESYFFKMMDLSKYCPEERWLVHGDYGFGNILVQDGRVTAVLDWMDAQYGDFLYDVAWLDFWSPLDHWYEWFQQHYLRTERIVPYYKERILCWQYSITLNAMKFYAKAGSKESYQFVKDRIGFLSNQAGLSI